MPDRVPSDGGGKAREPRLRDFPGMAQVCLAHAYGYRDTNPYEAARELPKRCICELDADAGKRRRGEAIAALRTARTETARAAWLLAGFEREAPDDS